MTIQDPQNHYTETTDASMQMRMAAIEWALWSAGLHYPEEWHSKNTVCSVKLRHEGGPQNRDRWVLQVNGRKQVLSGELSTDQAKATAQREYASHVMSAFAIAA